MLSVITYILGVAERSPKQFLKRLENTEFTTKPNVMSTLEQLLEMGREEGLYKNHIFNLLKTALRFPNWPATELSDFTELDLETISTFLSVKLQGNETALQKYVHEDLLAGIPLSAGEEEKLSRFIEQLTAV